MRCAGLPGSGGRILNRFGAMDSAKPLPLNSRPTRRAAPGSSSVTGPSMTRSIDDPVHGQGLRTNLLSGTTTRSQDLNNGFTY
jgi:hypothetical protein